MQVQCMAIQAICRCKDLNYCLYTKKILILEIIESLIFFLILVNLLGILLYKSSIENCCDEKAVSRPDGQISF